MRKLILFIFIAITFCVMSYSPLINKTSAVGLSANTSILDIDQRGVLPESITVDGDSSTIYRGAMLSWNTSTNKVVAKLAASTTNCPALVGLAGRKTTSATGIIPVYYDFYLKNRTVYGTPEVGKTVYLKSKSDYLSDDLYVVSGETAALTVGTSITFTNGNATVTGVGTSFTTELAVGDDIYGDTDGSAYKQTISAIASDTSLTLDTVYAGTGGADTAATAVYVSDITTESTQTYGSDVYYNLPIGNICGYNSDGWVVHVSREFTPLAGPTSGTSLTLSNNLTVGGTFDATGNSTVGGTFETTGAYTAAGDILSDEIDAENAGAMLIGKATATSVEIADTGVVTDIQGGVTIEGDIDTAGASTMTVGASSATKVEVADSGVETEIQGTLDVQEDANFATGVIAGVKDIVTSGVGQVVAEYTFPWNDVTQTEAAAAFAKVYDESATAYLNLSGSSAGAGYTADYQFFPDTEAEDDACYFGGTAAFGNMYFDMSATVGVYNADSITWEYWNGAAWSALTIIYDHTDTTAQDGLRPFQQDGDIFFSAPTDWASTTVDSQAAYWVRARCNATVDITTIPLTNSVEHKITTLDSGTIIPYACTVGRGRFNFETISGANNDTKVILYNSTSGACSAIVTLTQAKNDPTVSDFALTVAADDVIGFYIVQEDGTTEYAGGTVEFTVTRS